MKRSDDRKTEILKKKAELLKQQQELTRKLELADRQRTKRKKRTGHDRTSLIQHKNSPLPVYTLPFTLRPRDKTPKLCTNHQLNFFDDKENIKVESQKDDREINKSDAPIKAVCFLKGPINSESDLRPMNSGSDLYTPINRITHVCIIGTSSIRAIDTESWTGKSWDTSEAFCNREVSGVVALGAGSHIIGLLTTNSAVIHLDNAKEMYSVSDSRLLTFDNDLDYLFLSVELASPSSGCLIQILSYSFSQTPCHTPQNTSEKSTLKNLTHTPRTDFDIPQNLSESSTWPCHPILSLFCEIASPGRVHSLRHYSDRVLGTTDTGAIYIWSRDSGEMLCELNLPGSDNALLCRAVRCRNFNTFMCVSSGKTLYSLTLSETLEEQKLVGEVQTQGNVFVCGFYAVCSEGEVIYVFNLISEMLAAKFYIPGMELVDVCSDSPIFLIRNEKCLQICCLDFKTGD